MRVGELDVVVREVDMRRMAYACVLILSFSACATVGGMRSAPVEEGIARIFAADVDDVRIAAYNALIGSGLEIEEITETSRDTWMLIAKKPTGGWSWGELVRVVVSPALDGERTRVTILTRRRSALNVTAKDDYSDEVFDQIGFQLVRDGDQS
jgi:hypothetical protein